VIFSKLFFDSHLNFVLIFQIDKKFQFYILFDMAGNRKSLAADLDFNGTIKADFKNTYTYDGKHRMTVVKQQSQAGGNPVAEKHATFSYNTMDQMTAINRYATVGGTGNLVANTTFDYDFHSRLTSIAHTKGGTNLGTFTFTGYDNRSRITGISETYANTAWNATHTYSYDNVDQLTGATHSANQTNEAYAYDLNGNRDTATHLGQSQQTYTVGANNRTTNDGVYSYEYDVDGNRTKRTKLADSSYETYTWDARNRLVNITMKNSSNVLQKVIDYRYDHENRLLHRVLKNYVNGVQQPAIWKMLLHDDNQIVMEMEKVAGSDIKITNRYVWGAMVDQLLADEHVPAPTSGLHPTAAGTVL
jgi:YD repeat-containing protein